MITTEKQYVLNRETSRIELHFEKADYASLATDLKTELKRFYSWSRYASAWVSKGTKDHYMAIRTAEKLGFVKGGKIGEALSYAEQVERKAEKAEHRAERYEQYADNAEKRAEGLQGEFNEMRKDWSWVTQPNINSSKGRSFTNQRNRITARYEKGMDEYRKSDYFKEKAITASQTASMAQLQSRSYLNNRIEECNKRIRKIERAIVTAEEKNNETWLESLLEKIEYEIDKLAYFENAMDAIGGVLYSKETVKRGQLVKIRGDFGTVVKANPKTVEVKYSHVPFTLKYAYAEIQEMIEG